VFVFLIWFFFDVVRNPPPPACVGGEFQPCNHNTGMRLCTHSSCSDINFSMGGRPRAGLG
jgi:hypothetical protein